MKDDDALRLLEAAADPDPAAILDALVQASGAERGFLVLRDHEGFQVVTARNMDREEVHRAREKVSRTLFERALTDGRPVLASDADLEGVESLRDQKVRSVCALPLRSTAGAVYLDHRFERGLFGNLELLDRFASSLDRALHARAGRGELVGESAPMRELYRLIDRVAAAPYPVLVHGESGTGKELVARAIHRRSPRSRGPFVATNCATLPENLVDSELFGHAKGAFTGADRDRAGLFELAHEGTLFLDEIACLSPQAQESLLRVLEQHEVRRIGGTKTEKVDVRIVAASNEDLELLSEFRRDVFYRLNVLRLDLPPLRERRDDIPLLVDHVLGRIAVETHGRRKKISKAALGVLTEHRWPGNVRELENALRRAASLTESPTLEAEDFAFLRPRPAASENVILSLDDYLKDVLARHGREMDLQELADRLGVSRKTLWEKKKRWGL